MIDARVLAAMKPGAILVNIARGTLIDEQALYEAVKNGHLAGAGLDVVEHEPIHPDDPLLTLRQILVTPHMGGLTDLMINGTVDYIVEVIDRLKQGERARSMVNEPSSPRRPLRF